MKKTILKYKLDPWKINEAQVVDELPAGSSLLDVQFQDNALSLWAIVNEDTKKERGGGGVISLAVWLAFTGSEAPSGGWSYLRTLQRNSYVIHVFTSTEYV